MTECLCLLAVVFLWWKGFAQERPASPAVRRADSVRVFWSRWTIASTLPLVALGLWLLAHLPPFATNGRGGSFWIPAICSGVLLGSAVVVLRSAFVRVELLDGQLHRTTPWGGEETWAASALSSVSFSEGRGVAAAELAFASGQRLTVYPSQHNADELVRRLLLAAPDGVLGTLDDGLRDEILAARRAAADERAGGRKPGVGPV